MASSTRVLPDVATLQHLLETDTVELNPGDLGWVDELDGVIPPGRTSRLTGWTGRVVFVRQCDESHLRDETAWPAPTGGYWVRVRDIP